MLQQSEIFPYIGKRKSGDPLIGQDMEKKEEKHESGDLCSQSNNKEQETQFKVSLPIDLVCDACKIAPAANTIILHQKSMHKCFRLCPKCTGIIMQMFQETDDDD
jgi:hypothetical protein